MINSDHMQGADSYQVNESKEPLAKLGANPIQNTLSEPNFESKEPLAMFGPKNNIKVDSENLQIMNNQNKNPTDPVQFVLGAGIFTFLIIGMFFVAGPLSMITMGIGGILSVYHLVSYGSTKSLTNKKGSKYPSAFFLVLIGSPFLLGGIIIYEGVMLSEAPARIFLLWGLTITFWTTMLFVPMSIVSKRREVLRPELKNHPLVSVIVPAFNEEVVIKKTLQAIIEVQYPRKEIIFVDDGSTDRTLSIAKQFKNLVTILHKENGGKASALNYGILYAKGEIIVIVDADTIIGRRAITELVKGFESNKNVGAVAANVKIKNRINWITKCQAVEFIVGLQIVRRAFDEFGAITIVPGALGAFKKEHFANTGSYGHETIVEDFDQTIKVLKTGLITQGSDKAVAYTEAPSTVAEFAKQRKRWYRGNIQVLSRHKDAMTNTRYGNLQKIASPYLFLGMVISPIIGIVTIANVIWGLLTGDALWVLQAVGIFMVGHILMSVLAIRIDNEDLKLLPYAAFMQFGYKQIVDFLLLRALIEQLLGKKAIWTSIKRTGA
jgi:cellulose synthase/poly-beta-1,6-N-acetylglucosamine synthase-like glycosyltransferase